MMTSRSRTGQNAWRGLLTALGLATALTLAGVAPSLSGEAGIVEVSARPAGKGVFSFEVTVSHADTGWDHYADAFEIVAPDGTVLGIRTLLHPHVGEQPFTRSIFDVAVPAGTASITVRAHDSVHGFGGTELTMDLP